MKALIFLNGEFPSKPYLESVWSSADLVIAADGGARHALALNLKLDHLVGDMDSINEELLAQITKQGAKISRFDPHKDQTDLELALRVALAHGAKNIHLLGGEDGPLDHMLGNALIAAHADYTKSEIWLYDRGSRVTVVHAGVTRKINTAPGVNLSLFPLGENVRGVTLSGVTWPLNKKTLELGSSLTISNTTTESQVIMTIQSGAILVALADVTNLAVGLV